MSSWFAHTAVAAVRPVDLKLLPYPQELEARPGALALGPARVITAGSLSPTERIAAESLSSYLPRSGAPLRVRLGSVEEGYDASWLTTAERAFLDRQAARPEAYLLKVAADGVTIIGRSRWGMLYGTQTVNQLARAAASSLPCLIIRDWPDLSWRCLAPTLTWYSGWNRLEGYDLCNGTLDEWKWLVDWSLLHKLNAWAVCMYGYWPFDLPGYEESTLQVGSFLFDPATGKRTPRRFVHGNIRREFLPELIGYAHERGIRVHAYIGKNSFNGGYLLHHPEANAGGAAEALPFAPGVREYWNAFIGKIMETGFDGFVFEDPEAYHVPNQNEACYRTFWAPWAETYGFHSREQTDANQPPLGVHVEYYTWLYREFDRLIREHTQRRHRPAEVFLISHILLSRIVGESRTEEELRRWFALVDERQGTKVRFIINEADEARYTALLGGARVASLGGRGGSCLSAWRRMTGVNNNSLPGPMGASVDWERDCQRRVLKAGGFGAMGYVFEWRSCEIYGYLAAQHLWRAAGVPGLDNENQTGFLDYAYRVHYGDRVGRLVAAALDGSPCVNDAMVLEEVHGAQYPETGRALHREYQLLAAQADEALARAVRAYRLWTGHEPDLCHPAHAPADFRWDGFDRAADTAFKGESLRWLCVELRRAQLLCRAALCHRLAARRAAEGAPARAVAELLDRAIGAAQGNQFLYQVNFDDDYHANEALCVTLTERLRALRDAVAPDSDRAKLDQPVPEPAREPLGRPLFIPWEKLTDLLPPDREARGPGLYLSVALGLNALRDTSCHGVVFTVQAAEDVGAWRTLLRRTLGKNSREWERWEVRLTPGRTDGRGSLRLRLVTDAYSRAQYREAASWEWALWGDPQLVRVAADGRRLPVRDLADRLAEARRFVVLDSDGRERGLDADHPDVSGAGVRRAGPSPLALLRRGEGRSWQWVEGFAEVAPGVAMHRSPYRHYLGVAPSSWGYARERAEVAWLTAPVPEKRETAFVFIGGTDYTPGKAELWCQGARLLSFDTGSASDARWCDGDIELRYVHGADTRDERITYGLSGVFVLRVPASLVSRGAPLALSVRMLSGGQAWFMIHEYRDAQRAAERIVPPGPMRGVILAAPPHVKGMYGLVGLEYEISPEDR